MFLFFLFVSEYKEPTKEEIDIIVAKHLYDSRDYNIVTPVRLQSNNICWSYASNGACETNVLKKGLYKESPESLRFSEDNLAIRTSIRTHEADPVGYSSSDNTDLTWQRGENIATAAQTLLQWNSPIFYTSPAMYQCSRAPFTVKNVIQVSGLDINAIKRTIVKYGSVALTYNSNDSYKPYQHTPNFGKQDPHGVLCVGWNDDVAPEKFVNFQGDVPPKKGGAWIIKNSWDTEFGDNGYLYLSYESEIWGVTAFDLEENDPDKNLYYYDGNVLNELAIGEKEYAAIFEPRCITAEKKECIVGVNVGIRGVGDTVTAKLFLNVETDPLDPTSELNKPESGVKVAEVSKTFEYEGSYTLDFDPPQEIQQGQSFSVVVSVTNNDGDASILYSSEENSYNDRTYMKKNGKWVHSKDDVGKYFVSRIKVITKTFARETPLDNKDLRNANVHSQEVFVVGKSWSDFAPVVSLNGKPLIKDTDYQITYKNYVESPKETSSSYGQISGHRDMIISRKGDYKNYIKKESVIVTSTRLPDFSEFGLKGFGDNMIDIEPSFNSEYIRDINIPPEWEFQGIGKDDKIPYDENKVCKSLKLKFKGQFASLYKYNTDIYVGLYATKKFDKVPGFNDVNIVISNDDFVYDGSEKIPESVKVLDKSGNSLLVDIQYKVMYINNIDAGYGEVSIIGMEGQYHGFKREKFPIKAASDNEIIYFNVKDNIPEAESKYGIVKFQYCENDKFTKISENPPTTKTYYVRAFVEESPNWNSAKSVPIEITIDSGEQPEEKTTEDPEEKTTEGSEEKTTEDPEEKTTENENSTDSEKDPSNLDTNEANKLGKGAIIGISVSVCVVLVISVIAIVIIVLKKRKQLNQIIVD